MVSFYANVILKIQAWGLGHLLCLIIGREEREVPDVAGGKVAPLSFVTILRGREFFREFYLVLFSTRGLAIAICTPRGEPIELCVWLQLLKACWTDNAARFCCTAGGLVHQGNSEPRINLWLSRWALSAMLFSSPLFMHWTLSTVD